MTTKPIRIIHQSDLPVGGFAGIVETRMAMNPQIWREAASRNDISHGLGDFIYLANGYFKPKDGAPLHPHNDVDIVSIILNGVVGHKGTLGNGSVITGPGVQVQRAGTGMQHSEFSLSDEKADIVQIWFRPPRNHLKPAYKNFALKPGELTTVLGGTSNETFDSTMKCQAGYVAKNQTLSTDQPFVALITEGRAIANGVEVTKGDLLEGEQLTIQSNNDFGLVLIQHTR